MFVIIVLLLVAYASCMDIILKTDDDQEDRSND